MKAGLRKKLIVTILVVGMLSVLIGLIATARNGTASLRETLGDNFEGLAHETAQKVDIAISREIADLHHLISADVIESTVKERNRRFEGLSKDAVEIEIQDEARAWEKADIVGRSQFLSERVSALLKDRVRIEMKEKVQAAAILTDKQGAVVASTHTLVAYRYDREPWWKETMQLKPGDIFLSKAYRDGISEQFVFDLAVPVFNSQGSAAIGALRIVFDVKGFLMPLIEKTRFGETGHAMLIDSEGIVLACPILPTGMHIPQESLLAAVTSMDPGWIVAEDDGHGGTDSIVGFSPVEGLPRHTNTPEGNRWHSFIRQAPEETHAPIQSLLRSILLSGGLSIGFLAIIGLIVSKKLVEPIHLLHEGAEEIGKGKLDHRLDIRTGDEIERLADEFNRMAEKLKQSHTHLEDKVRDRTLELSETVERLQEMDRLKSEFLSNMSHELRTPLTSIIGFSEILLDQVSGALNETQMDYVRNMFQSGHNLLEIISNLLDLSKIRSGKMQVHLRPCRIEDILDAVTTTISPLAEKKGLHLTREDEGEYPAISIDEGKVRQVLLNLLSNAVKFTGEGGSITIKNRLVVNDGHSSIEIAVSDTGVGIRPSDQGMIFDEFRQVDASYTRDNPGTGLGLPITKHFVEMHGGRLRVESAPGVGSTFTVSLPLSGSVKSKEKAPEAVEAAEESVPKTLETPSTAVEAVQQAPVDPHTQTEVPKILVVEDDRPTSELIGIYLSQAGYQVDCAYDGEDVVQKVKTLRPFAITLDIMLPGKDGWRVLEDLQADPETRDIPVIIVSMVEDPKNGFSLGAVDYLLKPLDKEALFKSLSKLSFTKKVEMKPVTILLIEQDPEISAVIKDIIDETAFGVLTASTIEEGITLALDGQPDIILLGMSRHFDQGNDVHERLMKYRIIKDIPIIVYLQDELTPETKKKLEGDIRKILHYDGQSIKGQLLEEIRKYEKLYPDKARMIDGLTGLYNERYLRSRLGDEIDRAFRYKRSFSLIVTNVDHFKDYNQRNGVEEGNKVLRDIAEIFRRNLRSADPICRIGGSTFMVLMTETVQRPGTFVAEKLRRLVESLSFPSREKMSRERLTISVGIATVMKDAKTVEKMLARVLDALDQAKREGGNRVESAVKGGS
ncbi:MAG: diguanylate cyclase [Nitrospiria bacterium]